MLEIVSGAYIAAPSGVVFSLISDFEKNPTWQSGMQSCVFTTPPPLGVGSRYDQSATFLGRTAVSTFEVVEFIEGRLVKATSIAGSFPVTFTRSVEPEGAGTRVKAIVQGSASGFFKLATPLLRRLVKRSIDGDYERLKKLVESA